MRKLACLEPLSAIGFAIGACALAGMEAGLIGGAVVGGAQLLSRVSEAMKGADLDDKALFARMQMEVLREADRWDDTPEMHDARTLADAAMSRLLPRIMMSRAELAATATESADRGEHYPSLVARKIADELGKHDSMFRTITGTAPSLERQFAVAVIVRALTAAMNDPEYATLLTLDMTIELGRAIRETIDAVSELQDRVDAGFIAVGTKIDQSLSRLSEQALRGVVSRFILLRPEATIPDIVDAIERFIPEFEAMRERVKKLDSDDDQVRGAQRAAAEALDAGDLGSARQHLAEAASKRRESAMDSAHDYAATVAEVANADLLAFDWISADSNWRAATAALGPYDASAAEDLIFDAASKLHEHGRVFGITAALRAAIGRWRLLVASADSIDGDPGNEAARLRVRLGAALIETGERIAGTEGAQMLQEAADKFEAASIVFFRNGLMHDWAVAQNNLGNALKSIGNRAPIDERRIMFKRAMEAYRGALTHSSPESTPGLWASIHHNIGYLLKQLGESTGGDAGLDFLTSSADAFRIAVSIYDRDTSTNEWAMSQTGLGAALKAAGSRLSQPKGPELLNQSILAFREALSVHTRENAPMLWALAQNNLANALRATGERVGDPTGSRLLAEAIVAYRLTFSVYTRSELPIEWAMVQNNLGATLMTRGARLGGHAGLRLIQDAIVSFRSSLAVRTREHIPFSWALTMANLGQAHQFQQNSV
ncbi:tetratricopeptide (TPR) repeat protein [Sphingomonas kyeonggiensis]|uniref:Tetratricopeptide (TPR) repeat protein n=1 Tax=Sphingomonas kyeonggiensis TaxID=1268553 RepID=A0A7W7K1K8_9SPHN|nr:hypothetical protein [Sphingomonas kyeonggiensis]MBB4839303.1 tetratricopeptide (TPR) repeat protein [Sphingomonas kyeonggiensis]